MSLPRGGCTFVGARIRRRRHGMAKRVNVCVDTGRVDVRHVARPLRMIKCECGKPVRSKRSVFDGLRTLTHGRHTRLANRSRWQLPLVACGTRQSHSVQCGTARFMIVSFGRAMQCMLRFAMILRDNSSESRNFSRRPDGHQGESSTSLPLEMIALSAASLSWSKTYSTPVSLAWVNVRFTLRTLNPLRMVAECWATCCDSCLL